MLTLNYKEFGQGEPLVILHGLFGMLDNWQTIAKQLAEHFTVFLVDQRNHGKSPHSTEHNYEVMSEDLHDFMTSKWIFKAHLIGHSMGGKTAMRFATEYPDFLKTLTIVDIAPKTYQPGHEQIFKALLSIRPENLSSRKEASIILEESIKDGAIRQFLLKNLSKVKDGQYRWKMNLPVIHKNYVNIIKCSLGDDIFEGKTLFIKGGQSGYIQMDDLPMIQNHFPKATIQTIDSVGHWVHAEAPKAFLQILGDFLLKA